MNANTKILAASALRDLARLRYAVPVKLDGRVTCAECGCKIAEGRENRHCGECRKLNL